MEPASQEKGKAPVAVVEMPVQWLDVGSWPALAETLPMDEHNNATECGRMVFIDSDDNIVVSDDPEPSDHAIGISDMIIVHTKDATHGLPQERSPARQGTGRQGEGEVRGEVPVGFRKNPNVADPGTPGSATFGFPLVMRTLAIDLGARRVGLALSDASGKFASPYDVLTVSSAEQAIEEVDCVVRAESVERLVVGVPLNMDDSVGPQARHAVEWGRQLSYRTSLPLILIDERLSSFAAEQQLVDRKRAGEKLTRGRKKKQLDAMAAAAFLQQFLDGTLVPLNL